jgi:hypothetical protein
MVGVAAKNPQATPGVIPPSRPCGEFFTVTVQSFHRVVGCPAGERVPRGVQILNFRGTRMDPRPTIRSLKQPVGFFISGDALMRRVPG